MQISPLTPPEPRILSSSLEDHLVIVTSVTSAMTSEVMMRPQQPPPQPQVVTSVQAPPNMKESQDKLIESVYRISSEIIHHKWLHKQK